MHALPCEISIEVSEDDLRRHGMTFDQVADSVRRSSLGPAGRVGADGAGLRAPGPGRQLVAVRRRAPPSAPGAPPAARPAPQARRCSLAPLRVQREAVDGRPPAAEAALSSECPTRRDPQPRPASSTMWRTWSQKSPLTSSTKPAIAPSSSTPPASSGAGERAGRRLPRADSPQMRMPVYKASSGITSQSGDARLPIRNRMASLAEHQRRRRITASITRRITARCSGTSTWTGESADSVRRRGRSPELGATPHDTLDATHHPRSAPPSREARSPSSRRGSSPSASSRRQLARCGRSSRVSLMEMSATPRQRKRHRRIPPRRPAGVRGRRSPARCARAGARPPL